MVESKELNVSHVDRINHCIKNREPMERFMHNGIVFVSSLEALKVLEISQTTWNRRKLNRQFPQYNIPVRGLSAVGNRRKVFYKLTDLEAFKENERA